MNARRKSQFKLIEIAAFDARRGYRRCVLPGVGASSIGGPSAIADVWKDASGRLVFRFSSQGYQLHCQGLLSSGLPIPEKKLGEFVDYVSGVLLEWLNEGVDDTPNSFYE